jgi:hypothetical protein
LAGRGVLVPEAQVRVLVPQPDLLAIDEQATAVVGRNIRSLFGPHRGVFSALMTRLLVERLWQQGLSLVEIARELGRSKSTVAYHLRQLGIKADARFARRYDWPEIRRYLEAGHSFAECRATFGFGSDAWAEAVRRGDVVAIPRGAPIERYLVKGRRTTRTHLKSRLIGAGLKENACEQCGIREWRGRQLSLALHHVNGDGSDNRLENLRLLCPNCHSQTDNYGGRAARKGGRQVGTTSGRKRRPRVSGSEAEAA